MAELTAGPSRKRSCALTISEPAPQQQRWHGHKGTPLLPAGGAACCLRPTQARSCPRPRLQRARRPPPAAPPTSLGRHPRPAPLPHPARCDAHAPNHVPRQPYARPTAAAAPQRARAPRRGPTHQPGAIGAGHRARSNQPRRAARAPPPRCCVAALLAPLRRCSAPRRCAPLHAPAPRRAPAAAAMVQQSELGKLAALNDPSYTSSLAVGPPFPELKPQAPGSGLQVRRCSKRAPERRGSGGARRHAAEGPRGRATQAGDLRARQAARWPTGSARRAARQEAAGRAVFAAAARPWPRTPA
jgi:hypothetical protein